MKDDIVLIFIILIAFTLFYTKFVQHKKINFNLNNDNNNILNLLPIRQLLENRDRSVIYDPLVAPERRVENHQYPTLGLQQVINIPTRGYPTNYQMMGILSRDADEKILQLFGRPTYPGSNQWEYYVITEQNGFTNKIPITINGNKEIQDKDQITIPLFNSNKGDFKVNLYNYNTPRYNPYLY